LLGLAGEAGGLLSEYKKFLRDGSAHKLFKQRVGEELGIVCRIDEPWDVAVGRIAHHQGDPLVGERGRGKNPGEHKR